MVRKEWKKLADNDPLKQWHFYNDARKYFKTQIEVMKKLRPGVNVVLHHIDFKDQFYETWWNVVPMWNDEHSKLHAKLGSYKHNEETKQKLSLSHKGQIAWNKGKQMDESFKSKCKDRPQNKNFGNCSNPRINGPLSEEARKKISLANTGSKRTPEQCANISASLKGRSFGYHHYTDGTTTVLAKSCPEGFRPGRIVTWKCRNQYSKENK